MAERFQRHKLIPGWRQDRLAAATVVVVGLGALGNETARVLAMAGVGRLICCDPDRVEESNLSRTLLFRAQDVGRLKVEAAAEALRALAPGLTVEARPAELVHGVGLAELRDADLVIGCLDRHQARLGLAGRCRLVLAPMLDGGTHPWGGEVRVFLDPEGPCFGCTLSEAERGRWDTPLRCGAPAEGAPEGAAAPSSAVVGAWLGALSVRSLMGLTLPGGIRRVDLTLGTTVVVSVDRDPGCPFHTPLGEVRPVAATAGDSRGALQALLPGGAEILLWSPALCRVLCPACDFGEERWGVPAPAACPHCGAALHLRTTLEASHAPAEVPLRQLGVPAREILPVRTARGLEYVELAG